MCRVFGRVSIVLLVVAVLVAAGSVVVADPLDNQVPKFQQFPLHDVWVGDQGPYWGHDEWSTSYGDHETNWYLYGPNVVPGIVQGIYMADDFADPFDTPVVHIRWWGSYMQNFTGEVGVQRFLLSFETDVPANPNDPDSFSHPGEPILTQMVEWVPDDGTSLQRGSGTFHERHIPGGGTEALFEYNAELELPFWQDPDTVYWLKVVALVDPNVDGEIVWGWHNRNYIKENFLASREPEVIPGEHVQGKIQDPAGGPETPVWLFQDAAVQGELDGIMGVEDLDNGRMVWMVSQNVEHPDARWPQYYDSGLDGPQEAGMERFREDLAFELFTVPCVIPGDANLDSIVNDQDASILAAHWQQTGIREEWRWGWGDFNDDGIVNDEDASILAAHWQETCVHPTPEPHTIVLLAGALLALPLLRRRKRT